VWWTRRLRYSTAVDRQVVWQSDIDVSLSTRINCCWLLRQLIELHSETNMLVQVSTDKPQTAPFYYHGCGQYPQPSINSPSGRPSANVLSLIHIYTLLLGIVMRRLIIMPVSSKNNLEKQLAKFLARLSHEIAWSSLSCIIKATTVLSDLPL